MAEIAVLSKAERLQKLHERRKNPPQKIDDASLPAGSPMHYYCISCGYLADTLPESWFMGLPKKLCPECQELKDLGWLEE